MQLKTALLVGLGFIFLGLGAIGILLPVWPTTPFVLVSVACFSSAPQIKAQILRIPVFREHIENYEQGTGLSPKTVRNSLIWLWSTLLLSMALTQKVWIIVLLIIVGASVTFHISSIAKAKTKDEPE